MTEQEEFEFRLRLEREQSSPSFAQKAKQAAGDLVAGAFRGAGSIGATLLKPVNRYNKDGAKIDGEAVDAQRRAGMDDALSSMGADPSSLVFKGGKLLTEVAGTLGVGGGLAKGAQALGAGANTVSALGSAGMKAGTLTGAPALAARTAAGAATGGASAGLVDPNQAGVGALVGGALPGATKLAGATGKAIGDGIRKTGRSIVGAVSPEVSSLAQRAKELGINIPADRLVDSKPMNALAATLNYVPFSGRAGTEKTMSDSMNRALSRTFGQDSDNVTMALRKAGDVLGSKFDDVLQKNSVQMTPSFKQALAAAEDQATSELGPEAASIIQKQIAQIQTKGAAGSIDGQTAYNIKKALDRIGNGRSDAAFYARDLKKKLMDALNESLGPEQAKAFGEVRKQYGNMLALENLAQNGAEGGVSVGRLANLKNINNPDLQELADIAAQFLRTRESPHGAMQRLVIGGAAGAAGGLSAAPIMAATVGAGRLANAALNSGAARDAVLGVARPPNAIQALLANQELAQLGYRAVPNALNGR